MPKAKRISSDSLSVGELLRRPFSYRVPFYQRDFSWKEEEVTTIWEDLKTALEKGLEDYFLGAIVLTEPQEGKVQDIVDGQQRLAVLSMILSAISEYWKNLDEDSRASGIMHDYLGMEDRRTQEIIPKLSLNETNDHTYQTVVLNNEEISEPIRRTMHASNKFLYDANKHIKRLLNVWLDGFSDKETSLLDLEDLISDKTSLIVIEVENDRDAFVIFETLNDRGLELAVSDLIKTYLFSLSDKGQINYFKQAWNEITLLVGASNLSQFLRHYWNSVNGLVREKELYGELKEKVRSNTRARQFVGQLRNTAELYNAIANPEHAYWSDYPIETRYYLDTLNDFGVVQLRPVLLAIMETPDSKLVLQTLRLLTIISFRYSIISGLRTGVLERDYSEAAVLIREGKINNISGLFQQLKSLYVEDTRFIEAFSTFKIGKASTARYILAELNDYIEQNKEKKVALMSGKVTLEHILPKNPGKQWKDSYQDNEDLSENIDNIGNLTLLEEGKNKGITNLGFKEKKEKAYETSSLAINSRIAEHDTWNTKDIRNRAKELANIARQLWRIDV